MTISSSPPYLLEDSCRSKLLYGGLSFQHNNLQRKIMHSWLLSLEVINRSYPSLFCLSDEKTYYYQASFRIPSIKYSSDLSIEQSRLRIDLKQKLSNEVDLCFATTTIATLKVYKVEGNRRRHLMLTSGLNTNSYIHIQAFIYIHDLLYMLVCIHTTMGSQIQCREHC